MQDIHIALISSDEFVHYASTAISSVLANVAVGIKCHFYVLSLNMTDKTKKKMQRITRKFSCTIEFPYLDSDLMQIFKDVHTPSRVSTITYARIVLPTILPNLDKIIYMDSDMFARGDISELWNIDLQDNYFAMVDDANKLTLSNMLWKYPNPKYFNGGLLVINAKLLREDNYLDLLRKQIHKNVKSYTICDQDVINDTFRNRILSLSPTWNMYAPYYGGHPKYIPLDPEGYEQGLKNPKIIHCLGIYRPWFPSVKHPYKQEFYKYSRLSPFYKIINTYDYSYDNTKFHYVTIYDHVMFYKIKSPSRKEIKFLNFPVFFKSKSTNTTKTKILGIKVIQQTAIKNKKITDFIYGLFRKKTSTKAQKYYFLSILIYKHNNSIKKDPAIDKILKQQEVVLNKLIALEQRVPLVAAQFKQALSVAKLHSTVFPQFKKINTGKDVVIVAAGPTGKYYTAMEKAVHIGMNSSAYNKHINFDYIFLQDYNTKNYIEDFAKLPAIKFYGLFHETPLVKPEITNITIPQCVADRAKAFRYYSGFPSEEIHYDIETFPLADFSSVVFPALQFALYTNPRRIYLVGCDCAQTGHYQTTDKVDLSKSFLDIPKIIRGYRNIKRFAEVYYPEVEFISINPVGLVGMFKDVYTTAYLEDHKEMTGVTNLDEII